MNKTLSLRTILCLLGAAIVGFGSMSCYPDTRLANARPGFSGAAVDSICLLPPVEGRTVIRDADKFATIAPKLSEGLQSTLKSMGYAVNVATTEANLSGEQVAFADAATIRNLGPSTARWVLVPVLDSARPSPALVWGGYGMSAYLFDKQTGELAWEGNVISSHYESLPDLALRESFRRK